MTRILGLLLAATTLSQSIAKADDFCDRIAPILEAKCIRCHGESARKGGLALHSAEALAAGGESGDVVEPGESVLVAKVSGDAPEMPKGGEPLSADERAALRRWVDSGAKWPEGVVLKDSRTAGPWWAIQPLKRPVPPTTPDPQWGRNPIDAFVLAAMAEKRLTPSPEADRRTLLRRLTFDLHGLPPTPEESRSFLDDPNPDAYERLVDRLLASPRYGERWGRHWLDAAHYGDTHGYDKDKPRRNAWRYRDYVINALNADKPYARFVREQVAGDRLLPSDPDALIATGFLAAGPWDLVGQVELREGTVDKEKTRLLDRDDMLSNVLSTFSSLTVHCARCHDHKFDPIPQRDYYRLQAVFSGVERGDRPFASRDHAARRQEAEARAKSARDRHQALVRASRAISSPDVARLDSIAKEGRLELGSLSSPPATASPTNGYHSAIRPASDSAAWVQVDLGTSVPIDEIRVVPARPTDFADSPGFGFPSKFRVEASNDPAFASALPIFEMEREEARGWPDEALVVRPGGRSARFVRVTAARLWKRTGDYVFALSELEILSVGRNVALGRPVTALHSIEAGRWSTRALVDGFSSRDRRRVDDDPEDRKRHDLLFAVQTAEAERDRLASSLIPPKFRDEIAAAASEITKLDADLRALATSEVVYAPIPRAPRPIHLLRRGDVEQPAERVYAGALSCVPGLSAEFPPSTRDDEGAARAALADWLADRENVLTWRSIVNRVWHHHFGRGIVETPNDFGRNGALPSHPTLLDWLAVEFRDGGGSLKALHRLIVTSATYRQSSAHDAARTVIDADNRFLWRQNRRRLEAEAVRDSVLCASGGLDLTMGGPGFEPFRFKDDHSPVYDHEAPDRINAPECRRRAIYRFTVRSVPDPFLDCLDAADPNIPTPVRNATLTALQALTLLNDPFMICQSELFAARLEKIGGDPRGRAETAFLLAFGRPPRDEERDALASYAERHGMARACRVLFNANEFLFVD